MGGWALTASGLGGFIRNSHSQDQQFSGKSSDSQYLIKRRFRQKSGDGFRIREESVKLDVAATALIICDVWDLHHCKNAVDRVVELAPRIDRLTRYLRAQGSLIIHAPSSCMDFYKGQPARIRSGSLPQASNVPSDIGQWCHWMPGGEEEANYPIDQSDGGCDSDPIQQKIFRQKLIDAGKNPDAPWTHQIPSIFIDQTRDYISDNGVEVWNMLEHHNISNVLLTGVHTNMCVLGRPFGLRQMAKNGKNVHLLRDLTDTMYNPQSAPFVSHFEGTNRIIQHIEKYVCPTTTSSEFTGGQPFRFSGDHA